MSPPRTLTPLVARRPGHVPPRLGHRRAADAEDRQVPHRPAIGATLDALQRYCTQMAPNEPELASE
jgi:hypothetical protein